MVLASGSPRVRALAAALRGAREQRGVSGRELAARLCIDQSYLSRIETGNRVPNIETTAMILATLRTPKEERERILDLARNASGPDWLTIGVAPGIPQQLVAIEECERAATAIAEWHPCMIAGLLQTENYMRSVVRAFGRMDNLPQQEIDSRIVVKTARQQALSRRDPLRFDALISEAALLEPIGSAELMAEQLRHLIGLSQRSNVSIRVLPQRVGLHPGLLGPFMLYDFDDEPPVVYIEHHFSGAFVQSQADVKAYRRAFQEINRLALDQQQSVELIGRIIVGEWERD